MTLTAVFTSPTPHTGACALLIRPGDAHVEGEKLKALSRAAIKNFRNVIVFLDDTTCGDTPEESAQLAQDWLDRNRDYIDDCGISLETMVRWSQFPVSSQIADELRHIYTGNSDLRQVMHAIALGASEQASDLQAVRNALPKVFERVAGYIAMRAISQVPVIGADGMALDNSIFDKAQNRRMAAGLLVLPDFLKVSFTEAQPAAPKPAAAAPTEQPTATILQFTPRAR